MKCAAVETKPACPPDRSRAGPPGRDLSAKDIMRFLDWPAAPQNRILSIYLNIEPSGEAVLRRRFEVAFKLLMQSLKKETGPAQVDDLKEDVKRARRFITDYQPEGKGLVLFVDDSEDFLWARELRIHVRNQAYRLEKPYILPLLEAFDEYERYGVILADKAKARVFTYCLGEIEEERGAIAWNDVQHLRTTGKDNLRSAFKLQRTAEVHRQWHLKHVAQMMEEMVVRRHFDRLILGGSKEAADELARLLPSDLRAKIAGRLLVNVQTHERELLEALIQLETKIEREEEMRFVEELIEGGRPDNRRALGLDATLMHLERGLIHRLVYSENFKAVGGRCPGCGYLFSQGRVMCGRCGSMIDRLPYLLEEMARSVVRSGGRIEEVRQEAARKLDEAGGIGAILNVFSKRHFGE